MQIGNCVLYDKGTKEGRLVTVIGGNATIMTQSGPVTWPLTDVSEAPVRVVELTDEVGAEEEMEIVQYPSPAYETDDADTESHQEDLAAEQAAPPRQDAVDPETGIETPPSPPVEQTAPQPPSAPVGTLLPPGARPPEGPVTVQPPSAPGRPGVLDGFKPRGQESQEPMELTQGEAAQIDQSLADGSARPTIEPTPAPENIDVESVELPKRFGSTWLAKQDPAFLRALLNRKDLTRGRLASIRDELDRRQA